METRQEKNQSSFTLRLGFQHCTDVPWQFCVIHMFFILNCIPLNILYYDYFKTLIQKYGFEMNYNLFFVVTL
jgi:hypothetical protein